MARRRGLTLVEVIVVLLIIGLLVALLLPAFTRVRGDDSNRARTLNNLRQLGLAAQNYALTYKGKLPGTTDGGPLFDLLPYVDEEPMYESFMIEGTRVTPGVILGDTVSGDAVPIKTYRDPSDYTTPDKGLANGPAGSSCHVNPDVCSTVEQPFLLADITDGTGNTIFATQRLMNCGGVFNPWFRQGSSGPNGANVLTRFRERWTVAGSFATPPGPGNLNPTPEKCDAGAPSSPYAAGIGVTMCDGSARFISAAGAASVNWTRACSPAGKDTIDFGW